MITLAHISDLHFGTEISEITECLKKDLMRLKPRLLVVSGDLTQRARSNQYRAAQAFLSQFPFPQLIIPGNHDIPLYDVARRFFAPLNRFRRIINEEVNPFYRDDDLAVLGVNTARSFTWINGRISYEQMELIRQKLSLITRPVFKVVVTHHPFIPPPGDEHAGVELVGRAQHALKVLEACNVDLLLAGHLHHGYTGDVRTYYPSSNRSIVVVQAGTAISRRIRQEPNAYNVITLNGSEMLIAVRTWSNGSFSDSTCIRYRLLEDEWRLLEIIAPKSN